MSENSAFLPFKQVQQLPISLRKLELDGNPVGDPGAWSEDSNSGHQLLLPPANWCPIFALPGHAGMIALMVAVRQTPGMLLDSLSVAGMRWGPAGAGVSPGY